MLRARDEISAEPLPFCRSREGEKPHIGSRFARGQLSMNELFSIAIRIARTSGEPADASDTPSLER